MTFEEALKIKSTLPATIIYNQTPMEVFVVPLDIEEKDLFMNYYYLNKIDDNSSRMFAKSGEYTVNGLYRLGTWRLFLTLDKLIEVNNRG
jgi:hypothetical protein